MNTTLLKKYAPIARREFIRAVSEKAAGFGVSAEGVADVELAGDMALVGERAFPAALLKARNALARRVRNEGFAQVMEVMAYTWFNRLAALRFMELHAYLDNGGGRCFRVLSNRAAASDIPEILEHAAEVVLPGLDRDTVIALRLAGDKDEELYCLLLKAQCNALARVMPGLFERLDDATMLLVPANLLHSDSPLRKLVAEIDEELWRDVEIIGWLYQFYISEKKDQVIGKVVKSEDIPAATQLFTPNWIVKYMVQNTLGRAWLATYPDSGLRTALEFYIEPAAQAPEVQAELDAITPRELDPERLTLLDPACGSGHILAEAYDLFKGIYLERGYRLRDIPRLVLENNLYGLDIDDRAAQLARFTVLMKARADDAGILDPAAPPRLNILSLQSSRGLDAEAMAEAFLRPRFVVPMQRQEQQLTLMPMPQKPQRARQPTHAVELAREDLDALLALFEQAKTFGSLIIIPEALAAALPKFERLLAKSATWDPSSQNHAEELAPLVQQAKVLAGKYDFVVTNPPYMGSGLMNNQLKQFSSHFFPKSKSDLFAIFIDRSLAMTMEYGYSSLITRHNWMFTNVYESFRSLIIEHKSISSMLHLGDGAFSEITGQVVQVVSFVLHNCRIIGYTPQIFDLRNAKGEEKKEKILRREGLYNELSTSSFIHIPESPLAYWMSKNDLEVFQTSTPLCEVARACQGLSTAAKDRFVRRWHEVTTTSTYLDCVTVLEAIDRGKKWFPLNDGGGSRKWYGSRNSVINWRDNGADVKANKGCAIRNEQYYFNEGITWSDISTDKFFPRYLGRGFIFENTSSMIFPFSVSCHVLLAFLASSVASRYISFFNPTLHFGIGEISRLPFKHASFDKIKVSSVASSCIDIARRDWDSFETSWDFATFPWISPPLKAGTVAESFANWQAHAAAQIARMQELETENNRIFIDAYGLQDELAPEVPAEQITLARADRDADVQRLISYAVGCMMGRYSLDAPGLVYAHCRGEGFDPGCYETFPADADGIVPVMDEDWFPDDAGTRFLEFLEVVWSPATLEENLKFVADSLKPKRGETPLQTLRRYMAASFFKEHHLKIYKQRPIYWLFSSGRERAFQCLVYLHRYGEDTLARMRGLYVTPLQSRYQARAAFLQSEIYAASSGAVQKKLQKELDALLRKQTELAAYDEKLRHLADQRIPLDLDAGVKLNYAKFRDLLAEAEKITGEK